ncbi:MAG TPA: tail sheath stabilizer and completion protein, partial [Methylomirabilota bacterium]|nr:tail sheath stabilizer and completion protein [Methylomirabilota bacterium]
MVFAGTNFYFNLMRKYIVVFGNFFSDIVITRTLPGGQQAADIRVPLQYAQKDKMLVRLNADPD